MEGGEKGRERQEEREGEFKSQSQSHWTPLKLSAALTPYLKNWQLKKK